MKELVFVTTNKNKVPNARRVLGQYGINVVHQACPLPEIQAKYAGEVAKAKAREASRLTAGRPVIVVDSAFHIQSLDGFPGTNVKMVTEQIGLEGYLKLLGPDPETRTEPPRVCYFEDALAFKESACHEPVVFVRRIPGKLAMEPRGEDSDLAKSALWKLFIPEGWETTLAEMTPKQLAGHRLEHGVEKLYHELGKWLMTRQDS